MPSIRRELEEELRKARLQRVLALAKLEELKAAIEAGVTSLRARERFLEQALAEEVDDG